MAKTNDTIDGLLAEFRGYSAGMPPSYHVTMSWADFRRMLDRFDAAHRREVATTKESLAVGNSGDCAKLREALLQVIRSMELESGHMCTEKKRLGMHGQTQEDLCKGCRARNDECWTMTLKRECEAALAAPPRNCDMPLVVDGPADNNADKAWIVFKRQNPDAYFDVSGLLRCIDWLLAAATEQEGGAK